MRRFLLLALSFALSAKISLAGPLATLRKVDGLSWQKGGVCRHAATNVYYRARVNGYQSVILHWDMGSNRWHAIAFVYENNRWHGIESMHKGRITFSVQGDRLPTTCEELDRFTTRPCAGHIQPVGRDRRLEWLKQNLELNISNLIFKEDP